MFIVNKDLAHIMQSIKQKPLPIQIYEYIEMYLMFVSPKENVWLVSDVSSGKLEAKCCMCFTNVGVKKAKSC